MSLVVRRLQDLKVRDLKVIDDGLFILQNHFGRDSV
jgi:hypothetical protein